MTRLRECGIQYALRCKATRNSAIGTPSDSYTASSGRFSGVYRVLGDAIAAGAFPGCAFGVLAQGKIALQGAIGHFTYDEGSSAVTPDTVYDVASLTKVVATTAAAMLLFERGQLDLDTPLGELLPGFVLGRGPNDRVRRVTLRHLLAHNSGLPGYVELFRTVTTPEGLLRACLELALESEPGTRTEYSDPGFILLGKALEVLTREPLSLWLRREVFEPLAMTSTGFSPAEPSQSAIPPTEEDTTLRHRRIQGEVQDEHAWLLKGAAGHAGLFSNVSDLLRFSREVLGVGRRSHLGIRESYLFGPETVEVFAQRQGPEGSSRALGWDTPSPDSSAGRHFSPHSIGHLGYSGCSLWIDLDARIAVALLSNRTWPDRQNQLIREVRPAFHNAVRESV
jgi:CubicO group peptidase (beta-lactamase class C family)